MKDLNAVIANGQELARDDPDLARRHYEDTLEVEWPAESRARILIELAEVERRGRFGSPVTHAQEAEAILRRENVRGWMLGVALLIAYEAQFMEGQEPDTTPLVEALPLLEPTDPYRAAQCHAGLGDEALYSEHYDAAAKHFVTAYKLYEAAGSQLGPCTTLRKLGEVELARGKIDKALQYARKVLATPTPAHVAILASELLGDALLAAKQPEDALAAYQQTLDFIEASGFTSRVRRIARKMRDAERPPGP